MEVELVEKGPLAIVGMGISTLLKDVGVKGPALLAEFARRQGEIGNRAQSAVDYAVSIDPPDYNDETDEFKLLLGVQVDPVGTVPDGMELLKLPASAYASAVKKDDSIFGAMYGWIRRSEYELADTYSIELHDRSGGPAMLLFPVRKKQPLA